MACIHYFCQSITPPPPSLPSFLLPHFLLSPSDNSLIENNEVECCPEKLLHSVLDQNVDIYLVRRFFTNDDWMVVGVVERKRNNNIWLCPICQLDFHATDSGDSLLCNSCLHWYQF